MHTSYPPTGEPRERYLRVRVSYAEQELLAALAAAEGRSVSELVRRCLPLQGRHSAFRARNRVGTGPGRRCDRRDE